MEFQTFRKIPRLSRDCIITEKIDGTNGQICIVREDNLDTKFNNDETTSEFVLSNYLADDKGFVMFAGSRSRWITPENDNHGFARWVKDNAKELFALGEGHHFGEWWGSKIQRTYNLKEKRFSLFNVSKWNDEGLRPECCSVVPTLYVGPFNTDTIEQELYILSQAGSKAAPGYMNPEGIVIYHIHAGIYFKKTIVGDEKPKGVKE